MIASSRIKRARVNKNLSQEQLGTLINVSNATICNYEKGTRKPSIEKLIALSNALEVSLDYLLGQDKNVISEDTSYTVRMSNEEIQFINELRKYNDVYHLITEDPKRTALLINKKLS